MRRRRLLLGVAGGALGLLLLAFVALLWVSNSPWGHERARRMLLESLDDVVRGEISVGRIEGSLLGNVRFIDVTVVDDQGRPFLEADTVALRLALLPLLRRRVELYDVHILNATVVVDKPPHEEWNFVRVFPTNPDPTRPPSKRRWGDWVRFHDVELVNTRVTVRTDWEPAGDLTPAQQQEALRRALSPESRENVVEVPGGYQNVMDFRELNA